MSHAVRDSKAPDLQLMKLWYTLKGFGTSRRARVSLIDGSGEAQGLH